MWKKMLLKSFFFKVPAARTSLLQTRSNCKTHFKAFIPKWQVSILCFRINQSIKWSEKHKCFVSKGLRMTHNLSSTAECASFLQQKYIFKVGVWASFHSDGRPVTSFFKNPKPPLLQHLYMMSQQAEYPHPKNDKPHWLLFIRNHKAATRQCFERLDGGWIAS